MLRVDLNGNLESARNLGLGGQVVGVVLATAPVILQHICGGNARSIVGAVVVMAVAVVHVRYVLAGVVIVK